MSTANLYKIRIFLCRSVQQMSKKRQEKRAGAAFADPAGELPVPGYMKRGFKH